VDGRAVIRTFRLQGPFVTRAKRTLWWIVRAAIGFGMLGVLLSRLELDRVWGQLASVSVGYLALAFFWQALAKFVWTARWRAILSIGGIERGFWNLLALLHVGLFFSTFLPTAVGGDIVRGWYTSGGRGGRLTGYATVLVERIFGLVTLALLAAVASVVGLAVGSGPRSRELLVWVAAAGGTAAAGGFLVFAWRGGMPAPLGRLLVRVSPRLYDGVERAIEAWQRPGSPRLRIFSNSMALQVIAVMFYISTARAVGLDTPAVVFFLVMPATVIVSMLPISIGGLGVREVTLVGMLTACGAPADQAGACAMVALAVGTTFALLGGLVYPFYRVPEEALRARAEG